MSLNNRCPPPCINPLRSLHRGEIVRYLGIPFGNCDTSSGLANDLDRKLTTKLRLWKGQARTLLGRKLVAQTLILSLLWYFTSAMIIPNRFINRWQAIINQFVLYNRIGTGKRGVNVVRTEFALTPKDNDGISIPHVKLYIHRQHLQLLQVFVRAISSTGNHDEEIWYRPMQAILQQHYGNFSRLRSSLIFLCRTHHHHLGGKYLICLFGGGECCKIGTESNGLNTTRYHSLDVKPCNTYYSVRFGGTPQRNFK
ncbi:unnamed protein product [Phytophthora lilii]|uniref:Unnamed protein product n=1 Tax=Phytophthora lilii TaxID=2077276 RepID=A0A9W6U5E2_9STRA|nr:unnamed protein product [Phytophthora lilii]